MIDELARIDPSFFLSFSNQPFSRFSSKSIDKNEISIGGGRGMRWIERRICRVSISTNLLIHAQLFKLKLLKSVKSIPLQRILVVRIGQLSVL